MSSHSTYKYSLIFKEDDVGTSEEEVSGVPGQTEV